MCKTGCSNCPLEEKECFSGYISEISKSNYNIIEVVEKWAQDHPQKTMREDFFEKFPNGIKREDGTPCVCPYHLGYTSNDNCGNFSDCVQCWNQLLE